MQSGARMDVTDNVGNTALHLGASNGHENVVALLISRGANVSAANLLGFTPLISAAKYGDSK